MIRCSLSSVPARFGVMMGTHLLLPSDEGRVPMDDLIAFLRARIAEAEEIAGRCETGH
ncbi:hypothetical protein [Microtetraspora fusca]|uniref:hypothetical protein n=1 Tax=Microtetraspora fusca TaxID=1997 RepID=UPI000A47F019|nr:hypothetical protein [Microtetraspora fusca]